MKAKLILKFKKNPLQILQWSSANAVFDGRDMVKVPWTQDTEYEIECGHHKVNMSFPYLGRDAGKATVEFDINNGETLLITYNPPIIVFSSGTILINKIK
jgi:hypothetical protein